jgi:hypothetical protein
VEACCHWCLLDDGAGVQVDVEIAKGHNCYDARATGHAMAAAAVDGMERLAKLVIDWKVVFGFHRSKNEGRVRPGRWDLHFLETEEILKIFPRKRAY